MADKVLPRITTHTPTDFVDAALQAEARTEGIKGPSFKTPPKHPVDVQELTKRGSETKKAPQSKPSEPQAADAAVVKQLANATPAAVVKLFIDGAATVGQLVAAGGVKMLKEAAAAGGSDVRRSMFEQTRQPEALKALREVIGQSLGMK